MFLALLASLSVQAPPASHRVLIQDVTIVSPERKTPLQHGYVVLENDRIGVVGGGMPPAGPWDSVVAGAGRVLIPGLIDGHTHLAAPAGMPLPVPPALKAIANSYAEQLPRSYLYSGFTTVIDLVAFDRAFLDRFKAAPCTRTATTAAARSRWPTVTPWRWGRRRWAGRCSPTSSTIRARRAPFLPGSGPRITRPRRPWLGSRPTAGSASRRSRSADSVPRRTCPRPRSG